MVEIMSSVLASHSVKKKLFFSFRQFLIINDPVSTNTKPLNFFSFLNQVPVLFAQTMGGILVIHLCPVRCQTSEFQRSWGQASVLSFSKLIVIFMPIVVCVLHVLHIFILLVVWFWNNEYPIFMVPTVSLVSENMFRIDFSLFLNYQHLKDNGITGLKFDCSVQTCVRKFWELMSTLNCCKVDSVIGDCQKPLV